MGESENGFQPPEQEVRKPERLTREEVIKRLERGENLENLILTDLDLAGLPLEGKSFRGSDIRGMSLYREEKKEDSTPVEIRTNIRGANFTDATIADLGQEVFFSRVDTEGATFGYTENLLSRRKRQQESGKNPKTEDIGGLFNFNGREGDFKKTKWINIDFGGNSGYEAIFPGADLTEATMEGCDSSGIDFSLAKIDNIKIVDPVSLYEMKINESQIETVAQAIQLTNQEDQAEFLKEKAEKGSRKALEDRFGIVVAG